MNQSKMRGMQWSKNRLDNDEIPFLHHPDIQEVQSSLQFQKKLQKLEPIDPNFCQDVRKGPGHSTALMDDSKTLIEAHSMQNSRRQMKKTTASVVSLDESKNILSTEQYEALKNLQQIHFQQKHPQFHYHQKFTQSQIEHSASKYNEIIQLIHNVNDQSQPVIKVAHTPITGQSSMPNFGS